MKAFGISRHQRRRASSGCSCRIRRWRSASPRCAPRPESRQLVGKETARFARAVFAFPHRPSRRNRGEGSASSVVTDYSANLAGTSHQSPVTSHEPSPPQHRLFHRSADLEGRTRREVRADHELGVHAAAELSAVRDLESTVGVERTRGEPDLAILIARRREMKRSGQFLERGATAARSACPRRMEATQQVEISISPRAILKSASMRVLASSVSALSDCI